MRRDAGDFLKRREHAIRDLAKALGESGMKTQILSTDIPWTKNWVYGIKVASYIICGHSGTADDGRDVCWFELDESTKKFGDSRDISAAGEAIQSWIEEQEKAKEEAERAKEEQEKATEVGEPLAADT